MEWQTYEQSVNTNGSLKLRLRLRHDEPNQAQKTVQVHYEIAFYSTVRAWHNLDGVHTQLSLNQESLVNQRISFDLRTKDEDVVKTGTISVQYDSDGTKNFLYQLQVNAVGMHHSVTQPTVINGSYTLPPISASYRADISPTRLEVGQRFTIVTNRPSDEFTHDIYWAKETSDNVLLGSDIRERADLTLPMDIANENPYATEVQVHLEVVIKRNGREFARENYLLTAIIPDTEKPTILGIRIDESVYTAQTTFNSSTDFIRNISQLRVTALGVSGTRGSQITRYYFRVKGREHYAVDGTTNGLLLPKFSFPNSGVETIQIEASVVDSRGRQSDWVSSERIRVHYYQAPIIGSMIPTRNNDTITIKRNWEVTSLVTGDQRTERNTATLAFYTRKRGQSDWIRNTGADNTSLRGSNSSANLSGTFPSREHYEFKIVLSDRFNRVEAGPFSIPTESVPISFHPYGKVGVNKLVDKDGAFVQVSGTSHLLELDGSEIPYVSIKRGGQNVLRFGLLSQGDVNSKTIVFENSLVGKYFKLGETHLMYDNKRIAYEDNTARSIHYSSGDYRHVANGVSKINNPTNQEESEAIIMSGKFGNDGFQIGYLPNKSENLVFRTLRNGVWTPWKIIRP